jgi:hypothetical protein
MLVSTRRGNAQREATEEPAFSARGQRLSTRWTIHMINKLNRGLTPGMPRALIGPDAEAQHAPRGDYRGRDYAKDSFDEDLARSDGRIARGGRSLRPQ